MATTIGSTISRVRNVVKAVRTDAFLTDRFIYSLITKYADLYIKQELEKKRLQALYSLFRTLPCVDLIEVDKVEACCDIESGCTFLRTKEKIPDVMISVFGPLIRSVTSIDGSTIVERTEPTTYQRLIKTSGYKYNKTKYYWYLNGYLFFPNLGWPQVKVDALFQGDISKFQCDNKCAPIQEAPTPIPDYLFALIEQNVLKELGMEIQIPQDPQTADKQSQLRS